MRSFSVLALFAAAVSALPQPDAACVATCQKGDDVCDIFKQGDIDGCCQAKCNNGLDSFAERHIKTPEEAGTIQNVVKDFKEPTFDGCVQWCRNGGRIESKYFGGKGLFGYCEAFCSGPDYKQKYLKQVLKL
jgi:hypothetical protein